MKKNAEKDGNYEEIIIPIDFIKKIDRIINTGMSVYSSRDDFVKNAVEMRLSQIRNRRPK